MVLKETTNKNRCALLGVPRFPRKKEKRKNATNPSDKSLSGRPQEFVGASIKLHAPARMADRAGGPGP